MPTEPRAEEKPKDLSAALERLPPALFERLRKIIQSEVKRREKDTAGQRAGQMTEREWEQWHAEQIRQGDAARAEKALREQLGAKGKPEKQETDDGE